MNAVFTLSGFLDNPEKSDTMESNLNPYLKQHIEAMRDAADMGGADLMGYTTWGCEEKGGGCSWQYMQRTYEFNQENERGNIVFRRRAADR